MIVERNSLQCIPIEAHDPGILWRSASGGVVERSALVSFKRLGGANATPRCTARRRLRILGESYADWYIVRTSERIARLALRDILPDSESQKSVRISQPFHIRDTLMGFLNFS